MCMRCVACRTLLLRRRDVEVDVGRFVNSDKAATVELEAASAVGVGTNDRL